MTTFVGLIYCAGTAAEHAVADASKTYPEVLFFEIGGLRMADHYGYVYPQETGACIAKVENGKIAGIGGRSYRLNGDRILSEDGGKLGYLSAFIGEAAGSTDVANKLFDRN
jgi:hypothetical protein